MTYPTVEDVARLIRQGMNQTAIAAQLGVSQTTVSRLKRKEQEDPPATDDIDIDRRNRIVDHLRRVEDEDRIHNESHAVGILTAANCVRCIDWNTQHAYLRTRVHRPSAQAYERAYRAVRALRDRGEDEAAEEILREFARRTG